MLVYDKLHRPGFIPHKLTSICSSCNTGFLWTQEGHTGHYILRSATGPRSNCISYCRVYYSTVRPRKEAQWITVLKASYFLSIVNGFYYFHPHEKLTPGNKQIFNPGIFIQYNVVIKCLLSVFFIRCWWASGKWHMPLAMEKPGYGRSIPTCLNTSFSLTDYHSKRYFLKCCHHRRPREANSCTSYGFR